MQSSPWCTDRMTICLLWQDVLFSPHMGSKFIYSAGPVPCQSNWEKIDLHISQQMNQAEQAPHAAIGLLSSWPLQQGMTLRR